MTVNHLVVGSIPTSSATPLPVAQLDRAADFYSAGREFESLRAGQFIFRILAQFGSASALGAEGRRFESCISDHFLKISAGLT